MSVSKRLRFEILRRDNHTCRYCGEAAPDVTLTVDHVVPVALGGTDSPDNLVAACKDCNAGKSSVPADARVVDDVAQDAVRWSAAMRHAADALDVSDDLRDNNRDKFDDWWCAWSFPNGENAWRPTDWHDSIDQFTKQGARGRDVKEAVRIAMVKKGIDSDDRWRYFCGVVWRMLAKQREVAITLADGVEDDA